MKFELFNSKRRMYSQKQREVFAWRYNLTVSKAWRRNYLSSGFLWQFQNWWSVQIFRDNEPAQEPSNTLHHFFPSACGFFLLQRFKACIEINKNYFSLTFKKKCFQSQQEEKSNKAFNITHNSAFSLLPFPPRLLNLFGTREKKKNDKTLPGLHM